MPKKTQKSESEMPEAPVTQENASQKATATSRPRARAAQSKAAADAPKAKALKPSLSPQISQTQAEPMHDAESEARNDKASFPALQTPKTMLPAPTEMSQGLEIAVPPVVFPALKKERRYFWGRVLFLLLISALLAFSALILVYRPTQYSSYSHSVAFLYQAERDTTQILYDGAICAEGISGECVRSERDSAGSTCAALIGDTLYLVRGKDVVSVSEGVLDFTLSQNGRVLCYRTTEQKLFYAKTGRNLKISTVYSDVRDARYCLSPDGEFLFYTYFNSEDEKTHADVFSLSGDKPLLPRTTDMIPVAIANDYAHIFYFNMAGDLYYMDAQGTTSLCRRKGTSAMELLFDREFEEVLIKDADGVALWQEGDITVIPQLKGAENLSLLADKLAIYRTLPCATQCLVRSLDENYYLKKGTDAQGVELVYLKKDMLQSVAFVDESESKIVVTQKGVYYLDREVSVDEVRKHLYRCPIGEILPVRLSLDVSDFIVNSDGSRLLHADHRGAIYASRVVGDALDSNLICDASVPGSLRVNASDAFYYVAEDVAYMSDNGRDPVAVKENPGVIYTDVYTTYFFVAEPAREDGSITYTVYTNHRNRRESKKVATGITALS